MVQALHQFRWVLDLTPGQANQPFSVSLFLKCKTGQINFCAGKSQCCCSYQQETPVFLSVEATQAILGWLSHSFYGRQMAEVEHLSQPWVLCFLVSHAKALQTHLQVLETGLSILLSLQRVGFCMHSAAIALCLPQIIWYFFFLLSHMASRHLCFHINTVQFISLRQTLQAKAVTRNKSLGAALYFSPQMTPADPALPG